MSKIRLTGLSSISAYSTNLSLRIDAGKRKGVLRQVQELLCLRELVVSSDPKSEREIAKRASFLEESLEKVTSCHFEESANLILVVLADTCRHYIMHLGGEVLYSSF